MLRNLPWLVWIFLRLMYWILWGSRPRQLERNFGPKDKKKFMSAWQAANLIERGYVVIVAGLGANGWVPAPFKAAAKMFQKFGYPGELTVIAPAGQGGRGLRSGSIDDWAKYPGLLIRLFSGHLETFRHTLCAAAKGRIEVQCIPQGAFCRLIKEMAEGGNSFSTKAGVGTFADPRVGVGTCIANASRQWVEVVGDSLKYTCPMPNVAIICATAADEFGNVYLDDVTLLGDIFSAIFATKRNGGKVIMQVGKIIPKKSGQYIKADLIDAIVVRPDTPQTLCFTQRRPFKALIQGAQYDVQRALAMIAFLNRLAGLTPKRGPLDLKIARAAALVLTGHIKAGAVGNIGVGLPEQVAAALACGGVMSQLKTMLESGPIGGVAASGALFGTAINPVDLMEACEVFRLIEKDGLDSAVLGALQVGFNGDVNLSRRGPNIEDVVGPGGATHITYGAKVLMFVMRLRERPRQGEKLGRLRFVEQLHEVTFSAAEALKAGKKVFYATDCGVFQLTPDGLTLIRRLPDFSIGQIRELLPFVQVSDKVRVFGQNVVDGEIFSLVLDH